jgi:hypothetical protein
LLFGRSASVIETRLWERVLRTVYGVAAPRVETAPRGHRKKSKKGERGDDPG